MSDLIATVSCELEPVRHYIENALSENTRKAYRADMQHYSAWGGSVPATPEQIAAYLSSHAASLSIVTLQRRLVSIAKAHVMQGYPDPVKTEIVKLTMRGIRRTHSQKQKQAKALVRDDLLTILRQMSETPKGKRDKALLMIGFAAGLRRSEIVGLDVTDVEFVTQGMNIHLRQSKTDRLREGRVVAVPYGRTNVCPVQIVKEWMAFLPEQNGALFRPIGKGGRISSTRLSDRAVSDLVKHYAALIGLDAQALSGHSLRAGLVTSCAMAGVASWIIRKQTGHRSEEMVQRYVRPVEAFAFNASGLLF